MRGSFHIGRIAGTDIKIHFTFFLLLAWIGYVYYRSGGMPAAIEGVVFVVLIFVCVLLHEFGHILAARRYGIKTPDITLLPIGGVARLEHMPDKPSEEVVVALAGPAVNVGIAFVLWIVIGLTGALPDPEVMQETGTPFLVRLFAVNLWLMLFNLIPAFPMDGGRVLRALLAMRIDYTRATQIAAGIGQGIALVFLILGLLGNPMLFLIGIFIYFGAGSEAALARMKRTSKNSPT